MPAANESTAGSGFRDERFQALADSFLDRLRRGEEPSIPEYAAKHPELAKRIEEEFSAMLALERGSPAAKPGDLQTASRKLRCPKTKRSRRQSRSTPSGTPTATFSIHPPPRTPEEQREYWCQESSKARWRRTLDSIRTDALDFMQSHGPPVPSAGRGRPAEGTGHRPATVPLECPTTS